MLNIIVHGLSTSQHCHTLKNANVDIIQSFIFKECCLPANSYFILHNGKIVHDHNFLEDGVVRIVPRLVGGKGGFGSMLRAIGAQIEKTTNREACRDLSGRRLRDINEEQRLKNWITQQAEREKETEERKKKRLERLMREPKHEFKDEAYEQERSELTEKVSDSVEQGFKAGSSGSSLVMKRKLDSLASKHPKKKKKTLLDSDDSLSSDDSDCEAASLTSDNTTVKAELKSEAI